MSSRRQPCRGQSLVEFALVLPILLYGLVGGADMARAYAAQIAVQNAARAGAESMAIDFTPSSSEATSAARAELGRTPSVDPNAATVTVTELTATGSACPYPPDINTPCYATMRVQYTFKLTLAWPMIPSTFYLDRSTSVRRFSFEPAPLAGWSP